MLGSSSSALRYDSMPRAVSPCATRTAPRLNHALASPGAISTALLAALRASSRLPCSRSAWASSLSACASAGASFSARRHASTASPSLPSCLSVKARSRQPKALFCDTAVLSSVTRASGRGSLPGPGLPNVRAQPPLGNPEFRRRVVVRVRNSRARRQTNKKNGHPRCPFQCCCYEVLEAVLETYTDGCLLAAQRGSNDALAEACITVVLHLVIGDVDFRPLREVIAVSDRKHIGARGSPRGSVPVDSPATSLDVIHRDKREVQRMRP